MSPRLHLLNVERHLTKPDKENKETNLATQHPKITDLVNQSRHASTSSGDSRLESREAAIKTEMKEIELISTKSKMEILRVENESLRKLVKKLESMITQKESFNSEANVQVLNSTINESSACRELPPGAEGIDDDTISISSSQSLQTNDSELTILRHFQPNVLYHRSTASSEHRDPIEDSDIVAQVDNPSGGIEADSCDDCSEIDDQPVNIDNNQGLAINEHPKSPIPTVPGTRLGEISGSLSMYDVPDDFDPEDQDHGLSDVETVTSDEALLAWGVGNPTESQALQIPKGYLLEGSDEDEEGWKPVNKIRDSPPRTNLFYPSESVTSVASDNTFQNVGYADEETEDGNEDVTEEDDTSTVLGEYRSLNVPTVSDEDKASTVAETRSQGDGDDRYQTLMRELGIDDEEEDMEKTRAEAEEEEIKARDWEYKMAVAEKQDEAAKNIGHGQGTIVPSITPTVFLCSTTSAPEAVNRPEGDTVEQHNIPRLHIRKASHSKTKDTLADVTSNPALGPLSSSSGKTTEELSLLKKFNAIMKTLTPGPSAATVNGIHGHHSTVGWINPKQNSGDRNFPTSSLLDARLNAHETKDQPKNSMLMSETERILMSFDPKEDVIGILRPKAKGEKNILEGVTGMTPLVPKKAKVTKPQVQHEEPPRKVGNIESQFKLLREQQLQHKAELQASTTYKIQPTTVETSTGVNPSEILQTSVAKDSTLYSHSSAKGLLLVQDQVGTQATPLRPVNWTQKPVQKVLPLPSSPRRRHSNKSRSPPRQLLPRVVPKTHGDPRTEEPELNHQKSLRFHDLPAPARTATRVQTTQPPSAVPAAQSSAVVHDRPKALISILKPLKPVEVSVMLPKNRSYNHEYIREVCIRNLPKDITYSTLLDQVSGGLLEKVIIDWNTLEGRVVFAEPEAARRFYKQVERTGFWVHTEVSHIGLIGNLVQCTLGGFLWTQHSSEMSPTMIQGIWKLRASRCLLINDFPKDITIGKLTKDVLKILAQPATKEKEIIETGGIKRNLQVSSTGFLACIRFSAITLALKVANELHNFSPEYMDVDAIYDADPCGGLMGKEPPSIWIHGKQIGNENPELRPSYPPELQRKPASLVKPIQLTAKAEKLPISQVDTIRQFGPHTPKATLQVPGQRLPIKPVVRREPTNFSLMAKKLPIHAQQTQRAITQAIHPPPLRVQPQTLQKPNQPAPPPAIFRYDYDNWDDEPEETVQKPPGAHWNHKEQNLVHEYNQSLFKKRRRGSDASKTVVIVKKKVEKPKEISTYDRQVYLTNLPRNLKIEKLLRFVRGGVVEYVDLLGPTSKYDTSTAYILFVHRSSARDYKNYLLSPALAIERHHRVVDAEIAPKNRFDGIRRLPSHHVRSESLTRCLRIDLLPKGTTLEHIIDIIEEGMNHSTLDFEHASIDISVEDKDTMVVDLRLMSIARAVWTVGIVRKSYSDLLISFSRDPCQGPVEELDEVNVEME